MTKKKMKLVIIAVICISALVILPFFVAWSYKLGESIIIINLPFSKGEILSYIAAAMGVSTSVIALLVAINAGNPDIKIKRIAGLEYDAVKKEMQEFQKHQEGLSIANKSPVEVSIVQIGLISKKRMKKSKNRLVVIIMWNGVNIYPIKIQPYGSVEICCDCDRFYKNIYDFGEMMEENGCKTNDVIFYVKLSCGEVFEFNSKSDCVYFETISKGDEKSGKNENADK